MNRKIPQDAFGYYWSLGPERSYQAVADHFNVSKRAVTKVAARENWSERIMDIEKKANEMTDQKMAESIEQMNERHIKMLKLIQRKALETLTSMPLATAIDAVRALDSSIKQERLVRGEPVDRSELSVENIIRKEYERWMTTAESDEDKDVESEGEENALGTGNTATE